MECWLEVSTPRLSLPNAGTVLPQVYRVSAVRLPGRFYFCGGRIHGHAGPLVD
jgi:hypothetical protein